MVRNALVQDFLVGKDKVTPALKNIENEFKQYDKTARQSTIGGASSRVGSKKSGRVINDADVVNVEHLNDLLGKIGKAKAFGKARAELNAFGADIPYHMDSLGKFEGIMNNAFTQTQKQIKKSTEEMAKFDMRLLSMLFGGMALQRAFGGALRSIYNSFSKAEDNTSNLSKATGELNASWEFLKFSIFDALDTTVFLGFVDGIVGIINWFSQMGSTGKTVLLGIITSLATLGTGMMLFGQIKLGWDSILGKGGLVRTSELAEGKLFGSRGLLTRLQDIAVAGIAIKAVFDLVAFTEGDKTLRGLIDSLGMDMALIGLASGKRWMIGFGLLPKLLPLGTSIKESGLSLIDRSMEKIEDSEKTFNPLKAGLDLALGSFGLLAGGALTAGGAIVEFGDSLLPANKEAEITGDTLVSKLIPATDSLEISATNATTAVIGLTDAVKDLKLEVNSDSEGTGISGATGFEKWLSSVLQ